MIARRLRRWFFGPLSSMKTTRESKKPFSPVMRVKTASETRCASRRALPASAVNCVPAACWPVVASKRRKAICARPSPPRCARPVTTNCALSARNASRLGTASGGAALGPRLDESIGLRNTERLKLLTMTLVANRALSSPTKGATATLIGWKAPPLSSMSRPALAGRMGVAAAAAMSSRALRRVVLIGSFLERMRRESADEGRARQEPSWRRGLIQVAELDVHLMDRLLIIGQEFRGDLHRAAAAHGLHRLRAARLLHRARRLVDELRRAFERPLARQVKAHDRREGGLAERQARFPARLIMVLDVLADARFHRGRQMRSGRGGRAERGELHALIGGRAALLRRLMAQQIGDGRGVELRLRRVLIARFGLGRGALLGLLVEELRDVVDLEARLLLRLLGRRRRLRLGRLDLRPGRRLRFNDLGVVGLALRRGALNGLGPRG